MRASTEPVRSTSFRERYGTPRLSLRTVVSVARKLARNLEPGSRSRAQNSSLFRGILVLSFYGPGRQPRDDAALEDQDQYNERHRHDHGSGGLGPVVRGVGRGEVRDHDRNRVVGGVEGERVGEQELVPGVDKRQDGRREHARGRQRHYHLAERLQRRRAVHLGRLFKVARKFPKEGDQNPDRQRQCEDHVRDDHGPIGVDDADRAELYEQGGYDRHRREEADGEYYGHDRGLEPEAEPRYRVGADGAEEQADNRRRAGDDHAVLERLDEVGVGEDGRVAGPDRRRGERDRGRSQQVRLGNRAHPEDPQKREQAHQHEEHQEDVEQYRVEGTTARGPLCGRCAGHSLLLRRGLHTEDLR